MLIVIDLNIMACLIIGYSGVYTSSQSYTILTLSMRLFIFYKSASCQVSRWGLGMSRNLGPRYPVIILKS